MLDRLRPCVVVVCGALAIAVFAPPALADPPSTTTLTCDGITGCYLGGHIVDCTIRLDGPIRCSREDFLAGETTVFTQVTCEIYALKPNPTSPFDVELIYSSTRGTGVIRKDGSGSVTCPREAAG